MIDFAGCGVVHMVGGISAMLGAWILGECQSGQYRSTATLTPTLTLA